jgi:hypothetical protein
MNMIKVLLWVFPLSLLVNLNASALARRAELTVLPFSDQNGSCPQSLTAFETPRPYTSGSFSTDGMIHLSAIATNITVSQSDNFSATWTGTLKPQYARCVASAIITREDGQDYQRHSYLRVQLADGKAKVILDMTGVRDANGYTCAVIEHTLRDGNPRWTWGGTD